MKGSPKPLPVGVIEAKAETEDPLKGMQQAKGYADCTRFQVHYVFATNGRRYGEFDKFNQMPDGPFPFPDFPTHDQLTARYAKDTGVNITAPSAAMLFMADSTAYNKPRYYQDAAIRAAFEKILLCEKVGEPSRVLLSLATGAGKTVIAANLLWRMHEAGRLVKPALFLCDRDELREQAWDKISKAFPKGSVRIVKTEHGQNAARNAKVHIATYQTLGLDDADQNYASFLTHHYPQNSFSVIVIDECHRSAWGRWSEVLTRNPDAIHIGLTATPRELRRVRAPDRGRRRDHRQQPQLFRRASLRIHAGRGTGGWLPRCLRDRQAQALHRLEDLYSESRIGIEPHRRPHGHDRCCPRSSRTNTRRIPSTTISCCPSVSPGCVLTSSTVCASTEGRSRKSIIFCTRDLHADRVAMQMQRLYAQWCKEKGLSPKEHYAFKCTAEGGSELIEQMRGSGERCFIACTVDLLATGIDIERLNAVVFFRYLESSISFYQMVGRGARIHEETQKYKFWLYDYTGVTDLFGTDFITKPTKPRVKKPGGDNNGGDEESDPLPLPEMVGGQAVSITPQGRYILQRREVDGAMRDVPIPVDEYRQEMIARVLREAATIHDFRASGLTHKSAAR